MVGAGPAGNNVAFELANLGYSVAVLDWRERIGDKLCTGIVGRECVQRFHVDDLVILKESSAASFTSPAGQQIRVARQEVQAYVIDRVAFVASLARKARMAGANYLLGNRVSRVAVNGEGVAVQMRGARGQETLQAKVVVIANGFGSPFPRELGLGSIGDFTLGAQVEAVVQGVEEVEVFLGQKIAPSFFAWLVPTREGEALVGLLSRKNTSGYLMEFVSRLQQEGKVVALKSRPRQWGVPLQPLPRTYGERVLVVGDAAGQVKPTTGGGIHYALICSQIAAQTLNMAFARNDFSSSQLSLYEKEWQALLARELRLGYYAHRLYKMLKDSQIEFLMNTVAHNGIHKELASSPHLSFDWHGDFLLQAMKHQIISRVMNSIEPLKNILKSGMN